MAQTKLSALLSLNKYCEERDIHVVVKNGKLCGFESNKKPLIRSVKTRKK